VKRPLRDQVPLQILADEFYVHVRTLRAAAHDGRLAATFSPRPYFGSSLRRPRERLARDSFRSGIHGPTDAGGAVSCPCAA